jgi:hypothetical protein
MYDGIEDGEPGTTSRHFSQADVEGLRRLLRRPEAFGRTVSPGDAEEREQVRLRALPTKGSGLWTPEWQQPFG